MARKICNKTDFMSWNPKTGIHKTDLPELSRAEICSRPAGFGAKTLVGSSESSGDIFGDRRVCRPDTASRLVKVPVSLLMLCLLLSHQAWGDFYGTRFEVDPAWSSALRRVEVVFSGSQRCDVFKRLFFQHIPKFSN